MINTKTEETLIGKTCVYCGEKANETEEYCDRQYYVYWNCDCEGANLEVEFQKIKEKLGKMEERNKKKMNKLRYDFEMKKLKRKYNIAEE